MHKQTYTLYIKESTGIFLYLLFSTVYKRAALILFANMANLLAIAPKPFICFYLSSVSPCTNVRLQILSLVTLMS